ncbi:MAG: right-handed parallel beta-helix repeat-containing protein [Phycisphaerae bacterium]|nr:right-handed parallel beta-helix repeat-containing protein [Phycisphaerae bacterium]
MSGLIKPLSWLVLGTVMLVVPSLGRADDCNNNGVPDATDISAGTSEDCQPNAVPDECDIAAGTSPDFNNNGVPDHCDPDCDDDGWPDFFEIAMHFSTDCNHNTIPDECEPDDDCNSNGVLDECDLAVGTSSDCNTNAVPDECDTTGGTAQDCNANSIPDDCELAAGSSTDLNTNGVLDECEADCNSNGMFDLRDIAFGTSEDCNTNSVPDECDLANCPPDDPTCGDINHNGIPDGCEPDCNTNGIPDNYDLLAIRLYDPALGTFPDEQGFTLLQSGDPSPDYTLEDDALHQGPTAEAGSQSCLAEDPRLDFAAGFELEITLEVVSSSYDSNCYGRAVTGYAICVVDDYRRVFYIWFAQGRIIIHNQYTQLSTGWSFDTTGQFHDYRFVVAGEEAELFIDDDLFTTVALGEINQAPSIKRNQIWFGDGTSCAEGETYLKRLVYRSPADPGGGYSQDCNLNGIPDECEPDEDCNTNGIQDICDIGAGTSLDCNANWVPDECELADNDCNSNAVPDDCELPGNDCNSNSLLDACELAGNDCNGNETLDECDLAGGTSNDCNDNLLPDECEPDCNTNGVPDDCDIDAGTSEDLDDNGVPDECDWDCNSNGIIDGCDVTCAGGCAGIAGCGTSVDCQPNAVPDECEPDCNTNGIPDDCDIAAGTSIDCNSNGVPDLCDLGGGTSFDCNSNAVPDECDIAGGTSPDLDEDGIPDECEVVIFVDADALGANDGTSWADAFADLQDAISQVATNGMPTQIWIAAGTYTPADPGGDRTATFQLLDGVGLFGGFAGGETSFAQRDPDVNETILSGDLNGDDHTGGDCTENSYHVVTGSDTDTTAVLDGVTVSAGNADGSPPFNRGAALYVQEGHPAVRDCRFIDNQATFAAVYFTESSPTLAGCTFAWNAGYSGGGGGGLYSDLHSHPVLTECTFHANTADVGGGMFSSAFATPVLVNCLFVGNWAGSDGGGMYIANSAPTLTNCTFSDNVADRDCGGIYVTVNSDTVVQNCILWGNRDGAGTGSSAQLYVVSGSAEVSHSCVQGGWSGAGGTGNIETDPGFVRDPSDGGDGWGTGDNDDFGDLRLKYDSPCIDAGDNEADTDHDTADVQYLPDAYLDGKARFIDDPFTVDTGNGAPPIVDMGVYEFRVDCNSNGVADHTDIAAGTSNDCNNNSIPDECDLAAGTADDCDLNEIPDSCEADSDDDGLIDACDGCPHDPDKIDPGVCGCGVPDEAVDGDDDGVWDCIDDCPTTPEDESVNSNGCVPLGACCFVNEVCFKKLSIASCVINNGVFQGFESICEDGCTFGEDGDFDADGDVDQTDYVWFEGCLSGPAQADGYSPPFGPCLAVFDFDADGDVDLLDFAEFAVVFN